MPTAHVEDEGTSPGNENGGSSVRAAAATRHSEPSSRELERARARSVELEALLAQLGDAVAVFALDGRVVSANPAARRLFGIGERISREDADDALRHWSLDRFAREADVRSADGGELPVEGWAISRALRGEAVRNQEMVVRTPAGATTALAASAVPLVDADGVQWGAAVVLREVNEEFRLRERLAREREAAERRVREQAELVDAAGDLVGALDLDEQLRRLARRAHRIAGADYAAVATVEADGRTVWRATDGMASSAWRDTVFPQGRGTAGRIIASNAPVVITGFPDNPEFPRDEFPAHLAEGMRTAFGVPLRADGRPFGAIVVGWRRDVPVPEQAVTLVQALADLAALAITKSWVLEASRERAAQLAEANAAFEAQQEELEQQATELEMLNTELQERNEELDARVAELHAVLDQMADGVLIVDPRGEFVRLNPAAERIYGRSLQGVPASDWVETLRIRAVGGGPLGTEELPVRRALRERRVIEGTEWTAERPDGSRIRLLGSASPLRDKRGTVFGAVLVFRDITERTRLVEEVHKATQLKERFFAQMSHELRTPINAILGYSNLIAEGLAGELPPQAQDMVGRIRRSGQHLLELVNDVLDISRLEAGKVQIEPLEFDLVELARDTMTSVEPQAQAKGLTLALDAPPSLRICSDPARVRQVLLNLASNGVKFTDRGEVRVVVEEVTNGRVALRVRDTGPGIAPEDRENVFAEFVQVGSRQKRQEGTGLGLPISRRLARLLGGELTLTSEVGVGSTFTLLLPASGPAATVPNDNAPAEGAAE